LRQAIAERQTLHGEVVLLKQIQSEVEAKLGQELLMREAAQSAAEEAQMRCRELEARLGDSEKERFEAEKQAKNKAELLLEASQRNKSLERCAQDAEQSAADAERQMQDQSQTLQLQSEASMNEIKLLCAEADLVRQGELQSALLELKALTAGQHELRSQLGHRSQLGSGSQLVSWVEPMSADSALACHRAPCRVATGHQPWEIWERPVSSVRHRGEASGMTLLQQPPFLAGDKVRAHADFLDSQLQRLQARKTTYG